MSDDPVATAAHTWEPPLRESEPLSPAYGLDDESVGGAVVIFLLIVALSLVVGFLLGWWLL